MPSQNINTVLHFALFIWFCTIVLNFTCIKGAPEFNVTEAQVNVVMEGMSDMTSSNVYYYEITEDMVQDRKKARLRIYTSVNQVATRECPLLFTIQGHRTVLSWELPSVHTDSDGNQTFYSTVARTLCLKSTDPIEQTISIMITSCSEIPISYSLLLSLSEDLVIGLDENVTTTVSPTLPDFYGFYYPNENRRNLLIQINSADTTCMKFSIQDNSCPVMDQETNIQFQGYWQTMSSKAGLTVRNWQFPDGFFIVFVVLKEDKRCLEYFGIIQNPNRPLTRDFNQVDLPRAKNITFKIEETMDAADYAIPTIVPLLFVLLLISVVFGIFSGFQHLKVRVAGKDQIDNNNKINPETSISCTSSFQTPIKIQDLKKVDRKYLLKQSQRYFWTILIISIFYCVPVFQLITNYLKVVYRTGEQDICYYNYYCARPLGILMDFNHIYSNIAYVSFGLSYIGLARIRSKSFIQEQLEYNEAKHVSWFRKLFPILESYNDYGVLQHFGLFYAMGLALVAEGLLSGAYHICPNQSNFQFDTSFMYVIAVLGIVKVYQFRHPIHISVNVTFIVLAFISSSAVLGLLFDNLAFKICFSVIYLITIILLLMYLYCVGFIKNEHDQIVTSWLEIFDAVLCKFFKAAWDPSWDRFTYSCHRSQVLLPIGTLFFNILIIVLQWTLLYETDFATQLLGIFVMNLFIYSIYYGIMKWIHDEYKGWLWLQPFIYAIMAGILWGFALNYFGRALSSWAESPAVSKTQNDFCIVANFYDNHDMWHFLSAGALFCSFMTLLTIDDDLLPVKHNEIPVF